MSEDDRSRSEGAQRPSSRDSDGRAPRESGAARRSFREAGRGSSSRDGDRKPYAKCDGDRKPYAKRDGDRKPYAQRDGDRKPYAQRDGDRKPYAQRDDDRKPYAKRDGGRKPYAKREGDRKQYGPRDGDRKPYAGRDERRPYGQREGDRKPYGRRDERTAHSAREGERRPYPKRDAERTPYPKRDGDRRPYAKREDSRRPYGERAGEKKPYAKRDGDRRSSRPPQDAERRQRPAGPVLPDDVTPRDLHGAARNELKTLSKENAEQVARHLAMVARLIDDDPVRAHEHALAASRSAGRVGVVRETVAITAYAVGDYALALREARTYRRISGSDEQIALIVDSERGVGRPDRALEVGRGVDRATLPIEVRVELAIAMSGARLDLGETERALQELDIPELDPDRAFSWSPGLFAARAAVLEELGRDDEARQWRLRAEVAAAALGDVDADRETIEIDEIEELLIDDQAADTATEAVAPPAPADASAPAVAETPAVPAEADAAQISVADEVAELLGETGETDASDEGTTGERD